MATPKYDALREKVIQWANRDREVFGVTANNSLAWQGYIGDFLSYAADEAYRLLRIPPMEYERVYTVESTDIIGSPNVSVLGTNNFAGSGGTSYNKIVLPIDFVEMKSIRYSSAVASAVGSAQSFNPGIVFNERTDERTFFDIYAETYSNFYWMRSGDYLYIKPALPAGSQLTFSYYRQLPALDADYSVTPGNYLFNTADTNGIAFPNTVQPFLAEHTTALVTDTQVFFVNVTGGSFGGVTYPARPTDKTSRVAAYSTAALAQTGFNAYVAKFPTVTFTQSNAYFEGGEVVNWLKDQNERILIWGALMHAGSFLDDDKIEARYGAKFNNDIESLNREEKMRRAKGANVQVHFNGGGLI